MDPWSKQISHTTLPLLYGCARMEPEPPASRPGSLHLSLAESFEPLLSKSLNGFVSVDIATGIIVYASPSMGNLLGWTPKAMEVGEALRNSSLSATLS